MCYLCFKGDFYPKLSCYFIKLHFLMFSSVETFLSIASEPSLETAYCLVSPEIWVRHSQGHKRRPPECPVLLSSCFIPSRVPGGLDSLLCLSSRDDSVGSQYPRKVCSPNSFCPLPVIRARELTQVSLGNPSLPGALPSFPRNCGWELTSYYIIQEEG